MMYRRNKQATIPPKPQTNRKKKVFLPILLVVVISAVYGFYLVRHPHSVTNSVYAAREDSILEIGVNCRRLCRDNIPPLNINTLHYARTFCDDNDTQIEAALRNGLRHPEKIVDPSKSSNLVHIATNDLYVVDSLVHSKPYLVPNAALMLQYIGERFKQLLSEQYPGQHYRFIVTSAFRSSSDVELLRRCNRNASESSCHCYGTTIDISYIRFRPDKQPFGPDSVVDHNELYLKNLLSQVLYELRYEGICYVKYERRQACYHITLRNAEYGGSLPSEQICYRPLNPESTRSGAHQQIVRHEEKHDGTQSSKQQESNSRKVVRNVTARPAVAKNQVASKKSDAPNNRKTTHQTVVRNTTSRRAVVKHQSANIKSDAKNYIEY